VHIRISMWDNGGMSVKNLVEHPLWVLCVGSVAMLGGAIVILLYFGFTWDQVKLMLHGTPSLQLVLFALAVYGAGAAYIGRFLALRKVQKERKAAAFSILASDFWLIQRHLRRVMEFYPWPPTHSDIVRVRPWREENLAIGDNLFRELSKMRWRMKEHSDLLVNVCSHFSIVLPDYFIIDPDQLAATTAQYEMDQYMQRLKDLR
jgi:hypothetical protein